MNRITWCCSSKMIIAVDLLLVLSHAMPCLLCVGAAVTKPGTAMLEEMRKAGKPVPPSLEKMAEFLDKMDSEQGADVPMVKPGECLGGWVEGCIQDITGAPHGSKHKQHPRDPCTQPHVGVAPVP